jgi:hypothetical protein
MLHTTGIASAQNSFIRLAEVLLGTTTTHATTADKFTADEDTVSSQQSGHFAHSLFVFQ